jgi:hypothetical protein
MGCRDGPQLVRARACLPWQPWQQGSRAPGSECARPQGARLVGDGCHQGLVAPQVAHAQRLCLAGRRVAEAQQARARDALPARGFSEES